MKKLIAAALVSMTALPAAAQTPVDPYVARGTEPFWALTIDGRTMRFEAPDRQPVVVPAPKVIHGFAGEIWQSRRIGVNTNHVRCSDGMSDRVYPDTVTVTVDGRVYKGCGGEGSMIEGEWTIQSINGRLVAPRTSPDVSFRGNRISGDASCNKFNGSFRFERGRIAAGPLATTRRACVTRGGNVQEAAVLRLFGQRLSVSSNRNGKLVLTGRRGETMVLAPRGRR
jgi:uncharacterized membrane protein/heat shock protein HslJ